MKENSPDIFYAPITTLPVTENFKTAMGRQDIKTLNEIMDIPVTELVNLKWFTNEILEELSVLLFKGGPDEKDTGKNRDRENMN